MGTRDAVKLAVLAERIAYERELRAAEKVAFDHEREVRIIYDAHERELRLANEAAVEKARQLQFEVYEARLDNLNHAAERMERQSQTFMPIDRWEREHRATLDAHAADIGRLNAAVSAEEAVTVRQDTATAILATSQSNRHWLTALVIASMFSAIGVTLTLITLLMHLFTNNV